MYVVITPNLKVSLTDDEDVAETLAKENGSILEMPGDYTEDQMDILNAIFQMIVDETVVILDNNRQSIELENVQSQKSKKELN